ncbi:MAG: hypothetical protein M1456_01675 [Actinobacteria bacterium]|nr:hypothetical protein [Actinomycetota bacterium]
MKGVDYNEFDDLTRKRLRRLRIIGLSVTTTFLVAVGYIGHYYPGPFIMLLIPLLGLLVVGIVAGRRFNDILRDQRDRYERSQALLDRITHVKHDIVVSVLMSICEIGIASYLVTHYNFNFTNMSPYGRVGISLFVGSTIPMYYTVQRVRKYIVIRREQLHVQ